MRYFAGNLSISLVVFFVVFVVYLASPVTISGDSRWSIHTSLSIINDGNTDLNEYIELIEKNGYYAIEEIDGRYYNYFPIGASLVALPLVAVANVLFDPMLDVFPTLDVLIKQKFAELDVYIDKLELVDLNWRLEHFIASFLCALTAVFIYLSARLRVRMFYALVIVLIFAFSTSSWSSSSRGLWQHGPSMLMLALSLYLIMLDKKFHGVIAYSAIPLALAFIIRPTNAIPISFITLYIIVARREVFGRYVFFALPFALSFILYNYAIYGAPFSNYYLPERVFHAGTFSEAMVGNLFSPARGLFIYSPVLLLLIPGAIYSFRDRDIRSIGLVATFVILSHWILISTFPHWWAGHSFGPRYFSDIVPFMFLLLIFFFESIAADHRRKKILWLLTAVPLIVFGVYANYKGAVSLETWAWNYTPTDVDGDPGRLWDWHDWQIFR